MRAETASRPLLSLRALTHSLITPAPCLARAQVLVSVVAMLNEPNPDSPANVDAAVSWGSRRTRSPLRVTSLPRAVSPAPPLPLRTPTTATARPQKLFREDPKAYRRKVRECAQRSLEG
jgi:ubiquitin-protein ligase